MTKFVFISFLFSLSLFAEDGRQGTHHKKSDKGTPALVEVKDLRETIEEKNMLFIKKQLQSLKERKALNVSRIKETL